MLYIGFIYIYIYILVGEITVKSPYRPCADLPPEGGGEGASSIRPPLFIYIYIEREREIYVYIERERYVYIYIYIERERIHIARGDK